MPRAKSLAFAKTVITLQNLPKLLMLYSNALTVL